MTGSATRAQSDPLELRSARGDPVAFAPALTGGETALVSTGMTETSIISFAPIRQRRFLAQSSSDPERPRQASDVAQVEAIAVERERRLIEQGEAMISGMGTMMTTEMNVAQRHIHELQEQEQATIMTSGLQIQRLEQEGAAHTCLA